MNCEELREMYELYALGVLEDPERSEIDAHVGRGCEHCAEGVKRARETNACVFASVPEVAPPARLRRKVLAAAGYEKTGWGWLFAWAAVSAGLLVAVLWLSVQDRRRGAELAEARALVAASQADFQRVRQALDFLNEPETQLVVAKRTVTLPPRARVFLNKNRGVLLLADNLPPAPAGKIYEMWVIPKGGQPRPAGLFQSDEKGNALHMLSGPLDVAATAAVAVTLEPESGSPAPTTTPVLLTAL